VNPDFYQNLIMPAKTKIIMLVMDGLGGLPREPGGKTELESAQSPNLDSLAARSVTGMTIPVAPGVTPGSGPGHLALFGYDPIQNEIGRGAMEALGVDFELRPDDLAARCNFCTIDTSGIITDRRAGRITTEKSKELIKSLLTIRLPGTEIFVEPIKEHRFALVLRAPGLEEALSESDPQSIGVPPLPVRALHPGSDKSAQLINQFIKRARELLTNSTPANMILIRGFARLPAIPTFQEKYGLHAACIALNGMYRGVARLVGMQALEVPGLSINDEVVALEENWDNFDFFYLHIKKTDTFGEMGDFDGKVKAIEEVDTLVPRLLALKPDVIIVCGDHSSPAVMKAHSWHPVPLLIHSRYVRSDGIQEFGERACNRGSLGIIPATQVMPLALANALRLTKYGA
jgi:2,3-bisphosphoglycerate-independent phosphoglycerate mutase